MDTPSKSSKPQAARTGAEGAGLEAIFRMCLLASATIMVALAPFVPTLLDGASSQAETIEEIVAPESTMLWWMAEDDAEQKSYVIDNYTITVSTHVHKNGERAAQLRVRAPSGETTSVHGQVGYPTPSAKFAVGKLDSSSTTKQVIVTSYTGGLHCCTKVTVLELIDGKWRKIELGLWDGDPLPEFPADADGDGTPDFVFKDDRFDYAFAPYSDSHKPPRIFNIDGGRVMDVGHDARFDPVYEAEMKHAHAGCLKHKNAACAAFVASASRVGRREWAWDIMLKHYRPTDWDFPTKCRVKKVNDLCPPGQSEQFREFPEALAWFLSDTGYIKP